MLVKNAGIDFPMIVDLIGNADRSQNVKGEILALGAAQIGMTIDVAHTETEECVRRESAVWPNEIVSVAEIDAEISALDATDDWLEQSSETKLIVTAKPTVFAHHA